MCTKFNVGDAVWAFDVVANEPLHFVVSSISIEEDCIVYYMRLFRGMTLKE